MLLCGCACAFTALTVLTEGGYVVSKTWADDGSYLVFAYSEDSGFPMRMLKTSPSTVYAYEVASGRLRKMPGYTLVTAEPNAPQAWLAPQDQHAETDSEYDSPVGSLVAWRFDRAGAPRRRSDWTAWPGPDGTAAVLHVDPKRGAWPSRLSFIPPSGGTAVVAELPKGVRTFAPLGWAPSGRYFAVKSQQYGGTWDKFEELPPEPVTIVMIDPKTGSAAVSYVSPNDPMSLSASWAVDADAIFAFFGEDIMLDEAPWYGMQPHFLTIGADGAAEESTAPASIPIKGAELIGRDRVAAVASTYAESTATATPDESDTGSFSWWHLSSAGFEPIETSVTGNAPLVSPRGKVVYETAAWPSRLIVSDLDGSHARVVWTSE